jgi:hypothetical protein
MNFRIRTYSSHLAFIAALGLLGFGCAEDEPKTTGNFSTGNVDTETSTDGGTTISGDGDGDSGDGDGDSGDGDGDGDGDPNLCPDEPGDDACTLCVKDACCLELIECDADADCVCMRDCVDEGGSNNQCKNMCGVQGSNQNFQAYNGCVDDFCQADCG